MVERLAADTDAEIGAQLFFRPRNLVSDATLWGRPGGQLTVG